MTLSPDRFAFNTVTLGGPLPVKLECMRAAGFTGLELWARDLVGHPGGMAQAVSDVRASGLRVTDFQPMRDVECMPEDMRAHRLDMAREQMHLMRSVGAELLLVCSNVSPLATDDPGRAAADLRALADEAQALGLRICYEALSWGRHVNRWEQAWDIVRRADHPALGLNLDTFHMAVRGDEGGAMLAELARVPVHKIFLVQLADYFRTVGDTPAELLQLARTQRLFPGEGLHGMPELVALLESCGYAGDYTFEVFNDDYLNADPMAVAERGMRSARWLCEAVGRANTAAH